ncbi:hypothetical protein PCANC_18558 [Puccinia coronata f. sp. avenae]|uniref:Uncharacterized protein n=1 Tax=Puccinia coronata f. sp. avenae TaxID=200324 RepID=A0A2N5STB8_9BASI|nr:hypothetical protein PCANC_18558 [Puccinia coronata f. sp. avenae]
MRSWWKTDPASAGEPKSKPEFRTGAGILRRSHPNTQTPEPLKQNYTGLGRQTTNRQPARMKDPWPDPNSGYEAHCALRKADQPPTNVTRTGDVNSCGLRAATCTAGINRSNTAVRAVLKQPCLTGGRMGTVRPKQEPTGRTDLSDQSRLVLCNRSQELIGQACPTRRQVLRSDSGCQTTGQTQLFEHRSNCRVRPVNAGSAETPKITKT